MPSAFEIEDIYYILDLRLATMYVREFDREELEEMFLSLKELRNAERS